VRRDHLLLGAAGASILLTQYIAVREIGSTFFSTEIVLLGAVLSTLVGPSLGYAVAHRIGSRTLAVWGGLTMTVHLCLPVGLRALVGVMAARGFEGAALGLVAVGGGLFLSGFYAVFLPRAASEPLSLPALYASELAGALLALTLLAVSPSFRVTLALAFAASAVVLHLGLGRRPLSVAFALAAVFVVIAYPRLDRAATAIYFEGYHGQRRPTPIEVEYSPYQRIDVIDDARGRRSLYLDGVPFYRSGHLDAFNVFLAEVPGALAERTARSGPALPFRRPALVVGSGSFSSAAHLHRLGYDVTVVELDAAVARIGFSRFADVHGLAQGDVRLVIADGRRFLAETSESFAVIALDVPAPYHVRTALLHTPSFYARVRARLSPGGVVALSLCDDVTGDIGRAIAASAAAVFPEVVAIHGRSVGITLLYAGAPLPFSVEDVTAALARDPRGGQVWSDHEVRALVEGVKPLDESRLVPVLSMARGELEEAFHGR
jgi:spermidine synthase